MSKKIQVVRSSNTGRKTVYPTITAGRITFMVAALASVEMAPASSASWQNAGSDWTTNANWSTAYPKAAGETATLASAVTVQNPNLASDLTIGALVIDNTGADYTVTATGTRVLTLSSVAAAMTITGGGSTTIEPELRMGGAKTIDTGSTALTWQGGLGLITADLVLTLTNSTPLLVSGNVANQNATTLILSLGGAGSATISGNIQAGPTAGTNLATEKTFTGTLRLSGTNTLAGQTNIRAGTVEIASNAALGSPTLNLGSAQAGGSPTTVNILTVGNYTVSNNITFGNGSNLLTSYTSLTLGGTQTSGVSTFAGTVNLTNIVAANGGLKVTAAAAGTVEFTGAISGSNAASHSVTKVGNGVVKFSGANTYAGATTINAGTLQFAKTTSLYNNVTANWTASNLVVKSGATAAFNVGGANEFTAGNIAALSSLGTGVGGFLSGSTLGLDTTNAAGGTFSYDTAIADANSGANALGLIKLGSNKLVLTVASTYSGGTSVAAGTLAVSGSTGAGNVSVATGAVLELDANTALSDAANLKLAARDGSGNDRMFLNFAGTEVVGSLTLGGTTYFSGLFNAETNPTFFTGSGTIAVPEPGTLSLLAAGAVLLGRKRRPCRTNAG